MIELAANKKMRAVHTLAFTTLNPAMGNFLLEMAKGYRLGATTKLLVL